MASKPRPGAKVRGREYNQGDHVCVAYETTGEQLAVAADGHEGSRRRTQRQPAAAHEGRCLPAERALRRRSDVAHVERDRLPARFLNYALDTHPSIVATGAHGVNPYYSVPPRAGRRPSIADKLTSLGIQYA